jgi:LCP family protein required for cell wall assembly
MTSTLPPELSARGASGTTTQPTRGARRWLSILAVVVSAAVFTTSVGGWLVFTHYTGKILHIPGLTLAGSDATGPLNILVVGSDSRVGLTKKQQRQLHTGGVAVASGHRSDTMMLVHVSGDRKWATVVSLPRDSYVTIPAYTDSTGHKHPAQKNKLNAAFAFGGAPLLIKTVQDATGITIDHYVEVGFAGVVNVVNAVGGVDVCLPNAVDDHKSGLRLPAGKSHIYGDMGLAFVRARYIDPRADLGRMQRQQEFIGSMFKEVTSAQTLLNPLKLNALLNAVLSSVHTDDGLNHDEVLALVNSLRTLRPSSVRFLTVPLSNVAYNAGPSVGEAVLWNKTAANDLFTKINDDQPLVKPGAKVRPTVPPSQISVKVLNGSSTSGLAAQAGDDLSAVGFVIAAPAGNASSSDATTTVVKYDPRWSESLKTLKAAFPDAQFEATPNLGGTFTVIVGSDYSAPHAVHVVKGHQDTLQSRTAGQSVCS